MEAIAEGTLVARYPRRRIERLAHSDPELAQLICELAFERISRLEARMVTLGPMSALEKVSAFVMDMAKRLPSGRSGGFMLVMSRYDIADYLILSAETVSRALTELRHRGAIKLLGSHYVTIINPDALETEAEVANAGLSGSLADRREIDYIETGFPRSQLLHEKIAKTLGSRHAALNVRRLEMSMPRSNAAIEKNFRIVARTSWPTQITPSHNPANSAPFVSLRRAVSVQHQHAGPTMTTASARLRPPVDPARDHISRPVDAKVTVVEYCDYECPYCRRAQAAGIMRLRRLSL